MEPYKVGEVNSIERIQKLVLRAGTVATMSCCSCSLCQISATLTFPGFEYNDLDRYTDYFIFEMMSLYIKV